jgi:hypothetical protein
MHTWNTAREFTDFPNDFTSTALMNVCCCPACASERNFHQPPIAIIDTSFNRFLFYLFCKNASLTIELFCICIYSSTYLELLCFFLPARRNKLANKIKNQTLSL